MDGWMDVCKDGWIDELKKNIIILVKKIRKLKSFHNFKMISQSYIISHLNYCNSIYYGITKSKINYLESYIKNYSKNDKWF